jgi:hypothetical protein
MKVNHFQVFGDLKVVGQADHRGGLNWWPCQCQCKCGNYREIEEKRLLAGMITSCVPCDVKREMEKFSH